MRALDIAKKAIVKLSILLFVVLSCGTISVSQEVTVTVTTNKKEVDAILAKEREGGRINRAFFEENDRCRDLLGKRELVKAEASCRTAIGYVEKLPKEHVLERSGVRATLALALLWQRRPEEAIPLLKTSLAIRIPVAGESDADTADLYSLLGSAHGSLNDVQTARLYFEKAESSYRAAFLSIGEDFDDMRFSYPRRMKNALQAHYHIVRSAGLSEEAEKLQDRLAQVERDFAKYLVK